MTIVHTKKDKSKHKKQKQLDIIYERLYNIIEPEKSKIENRRLRLWNGIAYKDGKRSIIS